MSEATDDLLESPGRQESMAGCLDRAIDYVRLRGGRVLPTYIWGTLPQSAVMYFAIDALAHEDRSMIPWVSLLLVPATIWRWVGTLAMQHRIQTDLRGESPPRWIAALATVLSIRMLSAVALGWGIWISAVSWRFPFASIFWAPIHVITSYYGILWAGLVGPLFFESTEKDQKLVATLFQWVHGNRQRMTGLVAYVSLLSGWAIVIVIILHLLLTNLLVAQFLGLDASDLKLTFLSTSWILTVSFGLFLIFDFFWQIAAVFLYYDLQSRRLGGDMRLRLRRLRGSSA